MRGSRLTWELRYRCKKLSDRFSTTLFPSTFLLLAGEEYPVDNALDYIADIFEFINKHGSSYLTRKSIEDLDPASQETMRRQAHYMGKSCIQEPRPALKARKNPKQNNQDR